MKLLYSWIYLYHSNTELHYLWPHILYMQINSLPAGGVEREVSPVSCTQNRAPLTNAALSDIIYIYIYAFSRRFYPKRLTVHSGYTCFISMCVPWESNPQPFALLTQCSTTEPQEHIICKMKWKWHPKFSENSRFHSDIQWYKNTSTGFWFWNMQCSTKHSPPANHSNFCRRDLFLWCHKYRKTTL